MVGPNPDSTESGEVFIKIEDRQAKQRIIVLKDGVGKIEQLRAKMQYIAAKPHRHRGYHWGTAADFAALTGVLGMACICFVTSPLGAMELAHAV